jgi:hypothetical protein
MPVPIKPIVNSQYAPAPASGRSASAASRALAMFGVAALMQGRRGRRDVEADGRLEAHIKV